MEEFPSHLPVQSIWLPVVPEMPKHKSLSGAQQAEVVVIGGGIAGIMTAWRLAEAGQDVTLLEAADLLNGDTGYTTAFVTRDPDASAAAAIQKFGVEKMRVVWEAARSAQTWLREVVAREEIDCDWVDCGSYIVSYEVEDPVLKAEFEAMHQLDHAVMLVTPTTDSNVPMGAVAAIRIPDEAQMNIRKFIFGLLKRPMADRIHIFEDSKVLSIESHVSGVTIRTANGEIETQQAFVTTGYPGLLPTLGEHLHSDVTYVIAAKYSNYLPITQNNFWDTSDPYYYFRRVNEDTILLGGRDRPAAHIDNPEQPHRELFQFLQKRLPGFSAVTHRWSGSIFATEDEMPVIGWMPEGQLIGVATGFIGSGMVYGTLGGMLLGDLALGKVQPATKILSPNRLDIAPTPPPPALPRKPITSWQNVTRLLLPLIPLGLLIWAWSVFLIPRGGFGLFNQLQGQNGALKVFPLYGLTAFILLWTQLMIGSLMRLLRRLYGRIERFHRIEGVFVILFAFSHQIWLAIGVGLQTYLARDYVSSSQEKFLWFGYTAIFLMCLTVATALLSRWKYIKRWWRKMHLLNYVVFYAAWIHSYNLGTEVRSELRIVWWALGITVTAALIQRVFARRHPAAVLPKVPKEPAFVKVGTLDQVKPNQPFCGNINGRQIALFNIEGKIYALDNTCTHADGPLCEGFVDGKTIECPLHASRFDITTGAVLEGPATIAQPTFQVRVRGEDIEIAP